LHRRRLHPLAEDAATHQGKRYRLTDARVHPVAESPPKIYLGGLSVPACDRAVAIGDGFMGAWPSSLPLYADALERAGHTRTDGAIAGTPVWWVIAECFDADRAIEEIVALVEEFPQLNDIHVFAGLPGESMDTATPRLRYIGENVLPEVRKRLAAPGNRTAPA
jgi:alkanesulfonate monooxygenase SsuD/methylene tetrahydromethanopterin reductase-like flavin-dependent oxidoreductase (luciferase family)